MREQRLRRSYLKFGWVILGLSGVLACATPGDPLRVVCFTEGFGSDAVFSCFDQAGKRTELEVQDKYTCFSPQDSKRLLDALRGCKRGDK